MEHRNRALETLHASEEQMKVIEEYNREHGTNLSYGKYMAMMGR